MRTDLTNANPAGRVDVLVFRILERVAGHVCPREWPVLSPHVQKWARRQFGPKRRPRRKIA